MDNGFGIMGELPFPGYENIGPLKTPEIIVPDLEHVSIPGNSNPLFHSSPDPSSAMDTENFPDSSDSLNDIPVDYNEWLIFDPCTRRRRPLHQYEFLRHLLDNPKYSTFARWINEKEGLCEILLPDQVVELWEKVKTRQRKDKMTYGTFSRGLRAYYKKGLMIKTGKKYTFRFNQATYKNIPFSINREQ